VERSDLLQDDANPIKVQFQGMMERGRGPHALTREYISDKEKVDEPGGEVWVGSRKSNRVEFRVSDK